MSCTFRLFMALLVAVSISTTCSADIVIDDGGLAGHDCVLDDGGSGNVNTRLFDEDASTNHARGNGFSLSDDGTANTGYRIDAISLEAHGSNATPTTNYSGGSLTLFIYSGTTADWNAGTGHSTATDGGDYYVDTNVTPLYQETLSFTSGAAGTAANGDAITFNLSAPLIVPEVGDYGFFFVYEQGTSSATNVWHKETNAGTGNGTRTSITTTNHGTGGSRQLNFTVQGKSVPEPTTATLLLGLGGLLIARRRRK